jgi:hypothetical protein
MTVVLDFQIDEGRERIEGEKVWQLRSDFLISATVAGEAGSSSFVSKR